MTKLTVMKELNVIIAADIFGKSQELEVLCEKIKVLGGDSSRVKFHVVGPYQPQPVSFESEQQAYTYFMEHIGIKHYSNKLLTLLDDIHGPKLLMGFSVGGSAIWQAMPNLIHHDICHVICFYSSQIRHTSEQVVTVATDLIFPKSEPSFSVDDLIAKLQNKGNVSIEKCLYQHGFLNKLSPNYNACGSDEYVQRMKDIIKLAKDAVLS